MTPLNAGLVLPRGNAVELVAKTKQAEARGIATVWTTGGGPTADTLTAYAAAAAATERVVLGTSIIPTYPRHPITLAAEAIALNDLAPGRIRLGIGPSHKPIIEGSYGIPMGQPLEHLREYLSILRALLWDGAADFSGTYYHVKQSLPSEVPAPKTPILISALRPNAFKLAGEMADGAIPWLAPVDYLVTTALPALQEGADRADRARPALFAHVPVAVSTDRGKARQAFRAQFPYYGRLPFYAAMFEASGFPVNAAGDMPDGLVDTLAVSGNAREIESRLREIRAQGIDELLISHVVVEDAEAELAALCKVLADTNDA
jgi:F420-dependent oxidoreductase-like protein